MLRPGKIKENILKRSVLKEITKRRSEIRIGAEAGEDAAAFDYGNGCKEDPSGMDKLIMISSDPVAYPFEGAGELAITRSVNNLSAQGAEPTGVMMTILLPEGYEEAELKKLVKSADKTAEKLNVEIAGGHTEVSRYVKIPVINAAAFGKVRSSGLQQTKGIKPYDDIILTKWIGLEGTSIIAKSKKSDLLKLFPAYFIEDAERFSDYTSICEEAEIAADLNTDAMHDVSGGGIFGALWEFAEASGVGLEIDLMSIPIRQETVEICEVYGLNPYEMASDGCLLIAAKDGTSIVEKLSERDIPAVIIGHATDNNDRIIRNCDETRYLDMPGMDELLKFFDI